MPNKRDIKLDAYNISKYAYRELHNFCLRYEEMKRQLADARNPLKGVSYNAMPHGSGISDQTANAAMIAEIRSKEIELIEQTAIKACPDAYQCMLLSVTNEDVPYHNLKLLKDIPISRDEFRNQRRYFYFLLAKAKNII